MLRDSLSPKNKKIAKKLILIGVPDELRTKVWLISSGALHQMKMNPFYYQSLCELSQNVPGIFDKQIEADLERTDIPGSSPSEKAETHKHLKQILISYSLRNSSIGYCQGFNYIINKLFQVTQDEESTFWLFCQIIEEILPINYFSELIGLLTDTTIIISVIKELFVEMKPILKQSSKELEINNYIHKWLIGLFTQNLSDDITNLIWDLFFLEGNAVLIQTSIILFYILKDQLLNTKTSLKDPFQVLNDQRGVTGLMKFFVYHFKKESFLYEPQELKAIQSKVKEYYLNKQHKRNEPEFTQIQVTFQYNKECDVKFPYCLEMKEINVRKDGIEWLVFCTRAGSVNVIEDYYYNEDNMKGRREGFYDMEEEEDCYDILVERRKHLCDVKEKKLKYSMMCMKRNKIKKRSFKEQHQQQQQQQDNKRQDSGPNLEPIVPKKFYVSVTGQLID